MATTPRGIRNNNPGNIEYGPFAQARGATGSDGRFAIFPTAEAGVRAMSDLLTIYQSRHGLDTVAGMIGRWAPSSENNTSAYANRVAAAMGIDPNTPFSMSDPNLAASMINAMIEHENGIRNPFTDVVSRVTSGTPMPVPPMPVGGGSSNNQTTSGGGSSMLRQGSSGDRVRDLQEFLNSQGANIAVDGQFGPQTEAAVRNYQQRNGLQVDGIVGPQTFGQISADRQAPSQPLNLRDRIERFIKARQNGAPFQDAFDYARGAASWDGRNQWAQDNPTQVAQAPQRRPESPPPPIPQVRPEQSVPTPRPRPEPPRPPMPTQAFGWPETQQRGFAPPPLAYSAPMRGTAVQPYDATRNANAIRNDPGAAPTGIPGFDAVAALGAPSFDATQAFAAPVKAEKQFSLSPSTVAGPVPPRGELGTDTYKDLMTRRAALLDPDPSPKFPPPLGPSGVYAVTGKSTLPPAPRTPTMAGFGMATNPPVVSPPVTTAPQLVARKLFGNATA